MIGMETKDFMKEVWIPKEISFAPSGYRDSKLINVLTCHHFSKELKGLSSGIITTYSVSLGLCVSNLGRYVTRPWYRKILILPMMRLFQCGTIQGALNIVFRDFRG